MSRVPLVFSQHDRLGITATGLAKSLTGDASAMAPRIVNGLTVRPRKQINPLSLGLLLLPDFVAIPVLVGLRLHRLLRYLDTKRDRGKLGATFWINRVGLAMKCVRPLRHHKETSTRWWLLLLASGLPLSSAPR